MVGKRCDLGKCLLSFQRLAKICACELLEHRIEVSLHCSDTVVVISEENGAGIGKKQSQNHFLSIVYGSSPQCIEGGGGGVIDL